MQRLFGIVSFLALFSFTPEFSQGGVKVLLVDTGVNKIPPLSRFVSGPEDISGHGTQMASIILYGADPLNAQSPLPVEIEVCNPYIINDVPQKELWSVPVLGIGGWKRASEKKIQMLGDQFVGCLKRGLSGKFLYVLLAMSGGMKYAEELEVFKELDRKRVTVVISAGNDSMNLQDNCNQYPICYIVEARLQNAVGVGAISDNGEECPFTNTAKWLKWERGCNVSAYHVNGAIVSVRGTSPAAALHIHNLIRRELKRP